MVVLVDHRVTFSERDEILPKVERGGRWAVGAVARGFRGGLRTIHFVPHSARPPPRVP